MGVIEILTGRFPCDIETLKGRNTDDIYDIYIYICIYVEILTEERQSGVHWSQDPHMHQVCG